MYKYMSSMSGDYISINSDSVEWSDSTGKQAITKAECKKNMDMVERAAVEASDELGNYILKAVTEDLSFTTLKTKYNIPCGKDMYFDRYRRFFYLLSLKK